MLSVSPVVTLPVTLPMIPPSTALVTIFLCPSSEMPANPPMSPSAMTLLKHPTEVLGPSTTTSLLRHSQWLSPSGECIDHTPRLTYWESLPLTRSLHVPSLSNCISFRPVKPGAPPASSTIPQNMEVESTLGGRDVKHDI